ncbi:hypothetical protein HRG_003253 [Hirsutella rhossiliensis]|uniref:Uncharacterized protein n=1 Tax=Hirsutella rhossiliensis TaxID=111463 RepID=A0A9P8N1K3_9HYPO|nr:uncharacterized protein HRG_03253 [Hirsutella rhossiliensis]KAH0965237.1 hypothetical protein HRG_03253 [Hirsutella rhossiliensis]
MSSLAILVACLVQHAFAVPLLLPRMPLSERADEVKAETEAEAISISGSEATGVPRFADLGIIVSAGGKSRVPSFLCVDTRANTNAPPVLGCLILAFAVVSYFRRRKENRASTPAPAVLNKAEGGLAPCATTPRQRTQSKLFDDLVRAAYAAHEASCAPAHADPATRRKSVASGIIYNGVPSVDATAQKRKSVAVPNFF